MEERECIISAPMSLDCERVYQLWRETYGGSRRDFYAFMTSPSAEREVFLLNLEVSAPLLGRVACAIYGL